MPVLHGIRPLPEGHPFKGTRISFVTRRQSFLQKNSSNTPNEAELKVMLENEKELEDLLSSHKASTTATKNEPSSQVTPTEKEIK